MNIKEKINKIRKLKDYDCLLNEEQDKNKIREYYNRNKFAYLFFHNSSGYLHMGISKNNKYKRIDLLEQVKIIEKDIKNNKNKQILELGYGRGANLYYLARLFPQKKFTGIDLSTTPLKKYKLNNISFIKGDYNNLSGLKQKFNTVFAIETICHSNSLSNTLQETYSIMSPGAKLIIFDGYYLKNFSKLDQELKQACNLTEHGMAVDHFHELENLRKEIKNTGFKILKESDFSNNILPSLHRFENLTKLYFKYPIIFKITNYLCPEMIARNAISGYLMPELIKSKVAGYYMHILEKG